MFKIGDKAVVAFVDCHDIDEGIRVGETVIITEDNDLMPWCIRANGEWYPLYAYQLELAKHHKKDETKTETQPMTANISIGAEVTHITIGGKRFRLVSED